MTDQEPIWLNRDIVDQILHRQIREHGGREGLRDENALEACLARPLQVFHYGDDQSIQAIAAAYGFAFTRGHAFSDGNKRVGFLSMYTFLGLNGFTFAAPEVEAVQVFLAVASGAMTEPELVEWVRRYAVPANA